MQRGGFCVAHDRHFADAYRSRHDGLTTTQMPLPLLQPLGTEERMAHHAAEGGHPLASLRLSRHSRVFSNPAWPICNRGPDGPTTAEARVSGTRMLKAMGSSGRAITVLGGSVTGRSCLRSTSGVAAYCS